MSATSSKATSFSSGPLQVFSIPQDLLNDFRLRKLRLPAGHPLNNRLSELNDIIGIQMNHSNVDTEQSSSSDDDSDDSDVSSILSSLSGSEYESDHDNDSSGPATKVQNQPMVWLEAPNVAPGRQFGFYRSILPESGEARGFRKLGRQATEESILSELRKCQLPVHRQVIGNDPSEKHYWGILLYGGGHFAGMIVNERPKEIHRGKNLAPRIEADIVVSKTFHRYTTRRKQGGSQAAHDNSGGKAKSAGATLRRYNEAALEQEVSSLLESWKPYFQHCDVIFLRIGRRAYKTFIDNSPFDRDDYRLRMLPFETNRPTIHELSHVYKQLALMKTSRMTPKALEKLDLEYVQKILPKQQPASSSSNSESNATSNTKAIEEEPKSSVPALSQEELNMRDRWERLVDMVQKGKVPQVESLLQKYDNELRHAYVGEVWGELPPWIEARGHTPTLLHVAAASDQPEMVEWLLSQKHADPTLKAGYDLFTHRPMTPYEMAPSKTTRNVFRSFASQHPDWYDWMGNGPSGARVQSLLNEDKESEKRAKLKERQAMLREKVKEKRAASAASKSSSQQTESEEDQLLEQLAKEKLRFEEAQNQRLSNTGARKLGTSSQNSPTTSLLGFSAEDRMRIERERRARAAEARLAKK